MMSLLEYANDVNLDIEKIKEICKELGINNTDPSSLLSETDIVKLDKHFIFYFNELLDKIIKDIKD